RRYRKRERMRSDSSAALVKGLVGALLEDSIPLEENIENDAFMSLGVVEEVDGQSRCTVTPLEENVERDESISRQRRYHVPGHC
ncbi:hypothetical protein H0H87_004866, partial [Tephrocybe sp. NHM501043]